MPGDGWTGSSTPYIKSGKGDAWGREAAQQGRSGTQRILAAGEVRAPGSVTAALDLPQGEAVIARERLILLDGQPVEVAHSYWPKRVAAGTALAETGRIRGGAVTLLADLGYRPGTVTEVVQTRPAMEAEADVLQLADAGEWVLTLTRTITTPGGEPYEVSVMVNPGRVGRLHYSMKVD
ncbi:UTRA domain-containing protein [Streptomyces sp. S186]|uniref:UTRA domain-containing protein n=1 Tax=Streptomyces sp. S186 TaxID=3434395 RepID=UPI003F66B860